MARLPTWYCYGIFPIDFGWDKCPTEREFYAALTPQFSNMGDGTEEEEAAKALAREQDTFDDAKNFALYLATKHLGWEGDMRGHMHVFTMPAEQEIIYGFVWKQDNNGSCFVISPVALPHLDAHTFEKFIF